jgi:NTE family protein
MSSAVVLAGGGVTGIAWETGVLLGLEESGQGVVSSADLIVGTSAGSTVGAQVLSGTSLRELYERQLSDTHQEISPHINLESLALIFGELAAGGTSSNEQRARIGEIALAADTVSVADRRAVIEWRLPSHQWPTTPLVLTAIHAHTGKFVTWTKNSDVSLVDAVASSCAVPSVWPCVEIHGELYYDGGLRTSSNAHLAEGYDTVTIIAPLTQGISPLIVDEIAHLRSTGSVVNIITTDAPAIEAMGLNSLDPSFRRVAAEHGHRQGNSAHLQR